MLSFLFRLTRPAERTLVTLAAKSLRLPSPETIADFIQAFAYARHPDISRTTHMWAIFQSLKLVWQIHQFDPYLLEDIVHEDIHSPPPPPSSIPVLGYAFIRHGDHHMEMKLLDNQDYLDVMARYPSVAWYLGSDDLTATLNQTGWYTSTLIDAMTVDQRQHHPLAHGMDWSTLLALSDADREEVMWRTILEFAIAMMSDVFLSTWASNRPRMAYALATAMSDTRAMTPFLGLDAHSAAGHLQLSKPGC
jgi:hypothetical protein